MRSLALVVLILAACSPAPEPIVYGEDVGAFCRMVISDERYGAEAVTRQGRVYKFDSIECLAGWVLANEGVEVHSLWVTDWRAPGELIPLDDAVILHSESLRSPMGGNLTAFRASAMSPADLVAEYGGEVLSWPAVLERVRTHAPGHGPT